MSTSISEQHSATRRLAGTALLAALILVLQTVASGIRIGPFTITLSLIPMILGAILYGPGIGALLGLVFGLVVVAAVVGGADAGGALMLAENPWATVIICLLKSTLAGWVSGLIARRDRENNHLRRGVIKAAIAAPVCNTGTFVIGCLLFFRTLLESWAQAAGFSSLGVYVFTGLVGLNFLVELILDLILVPVILRVLQAVRHA